MSVIRKRMRTQAIRCTGLIFLCFLLTSTGWPSWEYHLMGLTSSKVSDICTMVAGYLLQAGGIGAFLLAVRFQTSIIENVFSAAMILHLVCMVPAVLSPYLAGTLAFGFLMNFFCGVIAGYYLWDLSQNAGEEYRATVFGLSYGLSVLGSWLLSVIGGGAFYYSGKVLMICGVLTFAVFLLRKIPVRQEENAENIDSGNKQGAEAGNFREQRKMVLLVFFVIVVFSIVNSSGFAFPSADLGNAVNLELSRMVYAAGLVLAGLLTDKNRKYGSICALAALIVPFIILSLRGEGLPAVLFWVLSYFTFGFYAVFRIILFSDLARDGRLLYLSGAGLLAGRIGDAAGEMLYIALEDHLAVRVIATALLFLAAVAFFFRLYQILYVPGGAQHLDEKERLMQFSNQHDLSSREREVLRLLLEEKTNKEIAEALSVSESTIKFHMHNLLQKTGCKNRNDLVFHYAAVAPGGNIPVKTST